MEKKEAMKILKDFYDKSAPFSIRTALDTVIPEITVSEDERMKKAIGYAIGQSTHSDGTLINGISSEEALVWLEKQLEKKSDDIQSIEERAYQVFPDNGAVDCIDCGCTKSVWNEEDTIKLKSTITLLNNPNLIENNKELRDKTIDWLKSLRPQNWTKEDKERYISCLQRLSTGNPEQPETINSKWFKEHVYPQSTWKPTYNQMAILCDVIGKLEHDNYKYIYVIHELFNDLKKLREE